MTDAIATTAGATGSAGAGNGLLPDPGVLAAALVCAGIGIGVLLVVVGLRGTVVDAARPPTWTARLLAAVRSPQATRRLAAAVLVAVATLVVTRWPVASVGLGLLVVAWPQLFGAARAERAQIVRLEALVSWTESLRDTIAAHASLEQAIPATSDNAPAAIRPALIRLTGRIRARAPLESALLALAAELDDVSTDRVVAALILNTRRRGDRLTEVLGGLALTAREELDLRRRVSAGRAGMRRAVQLVVALTLGFAGFLFIFGRTYLQPYDSVAGQIALAVVIGMFAAGFAWMRRLSGLEQGQPFLERPGLRISPEDLAVVAALTGVTAGAAQELAREPWRGEAPILDRGAGGGSSWS
jgi:Flp pilus assembly protein TadB